MGHSSDFIDYIGPPDLHDGQILEVIDDGNTVTVHVKGGTGCSVTIEFIGVVELKTFNPIGMTLYALSEMSTTAPRRRFSFANWDEEDSATLDIIAEDVRFIGRYYNPIK